MHDTEAARPYHHGNLPAELLAAARTLLQTDGIGALKLRAITRAAGVSATAADPHFGNLRGLVTDLAASGFEEMAAAMGLDAQPTPRQIAQGYIGFAIANPALFALMFRTDMLDSARPRFQQAASAALSMLRRASDGRATAAHSSADRLPCPSISPLQEAGRRAANWALVHGLAMLAIDGRLMVLAARLDPPATQADLIAAALASA